MARIGLPTEKCMEPPQSQKVGTKAKCTRASVQAEGAAATINLAVSAHLPYEVRCLATAKEPTSESECVQLWQIDHDCLLGTARNHDHGRMVGIRVLFPVRHVGRDEDVVARRGGDADFLDAVVKHELRVTISDEDRGFRL